MNVIILDLRDKEVSQAFQVTTHQKIGPTAYALTSMSQSQFSNQCMKPFQRSLSERSLNIQLETWQRTD